MAEYLIGVSFNKNRFPQYEKLIKELEKVPNTIVYPMSEEFAALALIPLLPILSFSLGETPLVAISIYKIKADRLEPLNAFVFLLPSQKVMAYISPEQKVGEADVKNKNEKEIISRLVYYTGYILYQITKDEKYLTPRKVVEDIRKIKVNYLNVQLYTKPLTDEELKEELREIGCNLTNAYTFDMVYVYPYRARRVAGILFCCNDNQLVVGSLMDSEHGIVQVPLPYSPFFESGCSQDEVRNTLRRWASVIEMFLRPMSNE